MKYKTVLTIAGSDSCGGAGVQADLKTISSLHCYGMSVITALTAQNTKGVQAISPVPAKFVKQQLDSIFEDIKVDAVKTGLLLNFDIIDVVVEAIGKSSIKHIIVDPVMVAKNKVVLLDRKAVKSVITKLFPLATLITPNIDEAEYLTEITITDVDSMKKVAKKLSDFGASAVLVKGGHLTEMRESVDCLYLKRSKKFHLFSSPRIDTKNTHGAGCTYSSAITSYLALGNNLITAIELAKDYVTKAIAAGKDYQLGFGPGPTCHFCNH